eukprot:JP441355.1.p1 GENE.JP441355.1~~JP441355.1.p1  ORF type:complete len:51 (-),score=0.36 JP441355.1:19-171(-)
MLKNMRFFEFKINTTFIIQLTNTKKNKSVLSIKIQNKLSTRIILEQYVLE